MSIQAPKSQAEKVDVPCASFAEVLDKEKPTFLLVDIEGGEVELFDIVETLGTVRHVLIEIH